jgi:hypothetical protein
MFKVSPASLQTFIDALNCVLEDRVQYSMVHIPNVFCDGHLQTINCVGDCSNTLSFSSHPRCTETFLTPCISANHSSEELWTKNTTTYLLLFLTSTSPSYSSSPLPPTFAIYQTCWCSSNSLFSASIVAVPSTALPIYHSPVFLPLTVYRL